MAETTMAVAHCTEDDVLFGNRKEYRNNKGNLLLRRLAVERFEEYESADTSSDYMDAGLKKDRLSIKKELAAAIRQTGGRFLKRDEEKGVWVEVPESSVMSRVVDEFKRARKQQRKALTTVASPSPPIARTNQLLAQRECQDSLEPSGITDSPSSDTQSYWFRVEKVTDEKEEEYNPSQTERSVLVPCQPENELHTVDYPVGSENKNHPGKLAVRQRVCEMVDEYREADRKSSRAIPNQTRTLRSKEQIITDILQMLNDAGGAVKRKDATGRWAYVNQRGARQRIAYEFSRAIKQYKADHSHQFTTGQECTDSITEFLSDMDEMSFESYLTSFSQDGSRQLEQDIEMGVSRSPHKEDGEEIIWHGNFQTANSKLHGASTTAELTKEQETTASEIALKPPSSEDDTSEIALKPTSIEDNSSAPNYVNSLTFTLIFDAMNINPLVDGRKRVIDTFGDDQCGVEEFMAVFTDDSDDTVLKEYGFNKPLHLKRLSGFRIWFETVYKMDQTARLDKQTWLDFFTGWVRDGCPSKSQLSEQSSTNGHNRVIESVAEENSFLNMSQSEISKLLRSTGSESGGAAKTSCGGSDDGKRRKLRTVASTQSMSTGDSIGTPRETTIASDSRARISSLTKTITESPGVGASIEAMLSASASAEGCDHRITLPRKDAVHTARDLPAVDGKQELSMIAEVAELSASAAVGMKESRALKQKQLSARDELSGSCRRNDLSFAIVFNALKIKLEDDGPKNLIASYGDGVSAVRRFLAGLKESPEDTLKEHGFTKKLHLKRIRGFNVWFQTVYETDRSSRLNREIWVAFFTRWVRDGCPSSAQLSPRLVQQHSVRGENRTVESITEDMSLTSLSLSLTQSQLSGVELASADLLDCLQ